MFRTISKAVFLITFVLLRQGGSSAPAATGSTQRAAYFPVIKLQTQDGKEVRFYEDLIKGKTVVINFMYSACDGKLCNPGTKNLVQLQGALGDHLGRDVFMYSITLDPGHDTPEVLKKYANSYGVKPGWTFLTGKEEDITNLRRKLGLFDSDPKKDADRTQHSGMIVIGNDAFNKWGSAYVLARPDRIIEMIGRMTPPAPLTK